MCLASEIISILFIFVKTSTTSERPTSLFLVCICYCILYSWYSWIGIYLYIYIYIYIYIYHDQLILIARIPLTLSHHSSLSSIALGRSSNTSGVRTELMHVFATWPTLVCLCVEVHRKTSLMNLFLLLQQWQVNLVHLTWMACKMEGKWLHSCCFVGCWFQNFLKTAHSNLFS